MADPTPPSGQYGELKAAVIAALKKAYDVNYLSKAFLSVAHPIYVAALEAKEREIERLRAVGRTESEALLEWANNHRVWTGNNIDPRDFLTDFANCLALALEGESTRQLEQQAAELIRAEQREAEARSLLNMAQDLIPTRYPAAIQQIKDFLESKP